MQQAPKDNKAVNPEGKETQDYGNALFKSRQALSLYRSEQYEFLLTKCWNLNLGEYDTLDGKTLFHHLKQAWVQVLYLDYNKAPSILKQISETRFPRVRQLHLYCNSIESIEGLETLWMPELRTVRFDFNEIVSLNPLRKLHIPNISYLDLRDNHLIDLAPIIAMKASNLESFWSEGVWIKCILGDYYSWFMKMESRRIRELCSLQITNGVTSKKTIINQRLIQKIMDKFPTMKTT